MSGFDLNTTQENIEDYDYVFNYDCDWCIVVMSANEHSKHEF